MATPPASETANSAPGLDSDSLARRSARPGKRRVGRPSQRNPGETRAKILSSALQCFTDKGYSATTFAAVARGADLTGPAIYQYFDSKGALYGATLEHIYEDLLPDVTVALTEHQTFRERLRTILNVAVDLHEQHPETTAFLSAHPAELRHEPKLQAHLSRHSSDVLSALTRMFEEAIANGEISSTRSVPSLVMFFFGSVMGLCLYHHANQTMPLRESAEVFFDILENRLLLDH